MFFRLKRFIRKKNQNPMNNRKKVGILLFATSIGLFFLFVGRISQIVLGGEVAGTSLKEKTQQLYKGEQKVKARRGTIYDRNGVVIAQDASSYSVYAILSDTYMSGKKKLYAEPKNFDKLADILKKRVGIKKSKALETLKRGVNEDGSSKYYQVEFGNAGNNINEETKQKIEDDMKKEGIQGLYFQDHPARMYPNGVFASHFIGYAVPNKEDNGLDGKMGLEAAYDDVLKGKDGKIVYQKDQFQNPLPGTVAEEKKSVDGTDIYTTLDVGLQNYLETLLDKMIEEHEPENMTATLVQAKTGEIMAMAQRPTFNPETKEGLDGDGVWRNLLVQDAYEPGSTMKVFTTAAAVNEGEFKENETFQSGKITVADATINDHDLGAKGTLTMRQALSWSSNVGMVMLQERLGDRWINYLERFGFGQSTYSGLPEESKGSLPTENVVDQAMSAYGQAISVTNFQMIKGFTAIANNGKMLQPRYISKLVNDSTGEETISKPEVLGEPITAETAAKVREYMRDVVESENYGSAYGQYEVPGYHISAKTGTAQIPTSEGYTFGGTNYIYSIVEMIPSEDPEYILYITMKKPKNEASLGEIGNPLLKRAMEFKEDPIESEEANKNTIEVTDYRNLETDIAAGDANKKGLNAVVIGDGKKVTKQSSKPGEKMMANERLILLTNGEKIMPDVTGWSKADIMKLTNLLGVDAKFEGEGYCTDQNIAPYTTVNRKTIKFTLG